MGRTVVFEGSNNQVVSAVWSALLRRGYTLVRSFDLQDAITHHVEGCSCSHHGTARCTCQYVVLLAYPPGALPAPPRVFTIHASQQASWVTLHADGSIGTGETHVLMAALTEARAGPEAEHRAESLTGSTAAVVNN